MFCAIFFCTKFPVEFQLHTDLYGPNLADKLAFRRWNLRKDMEASEHYTSALCICTKQVIFQITSFLCLVLC